MKLIIWIWEFIKTMFGVKPDRGIDSDATNGSIRAYTEKPIYKKIPGFKRIQRIGFNTHFREA